MGSSIMAPDADSCGSRPYEVQQLAVRLESAAGEVEEALSRLSQLQLMDWQSPAGRAYRVSVGLQAAALRRARERLDHAALSVRRHAQNVTVSSGRTPAGGF
jgi:hypothetical protein